PNWTNVLCEWPEIYPNRDETPIAWQRRKPQPTRHEKGSLDAINQQKWSKCHVQTNPILCLRKSQLPDLPGNISIRRLFRRRLRCPEDARRRREQAAGDELRD